MEGSYRGFPDALCASLKHRLFRVLPALLGVVLAAPAWAADLTVPYVPTPQEVVERMLQMAQGYPRRLPDRPRFRRRPHRDHRGKKIRRARFRRRSQSGAHCRSQSKTRRKAGVTDKVAFYQRDLFETDLSDATVITMYLLPRVNLDLRPKLLDLKPGTRLVSHDFSMGDWQPDEQVRMNVKTKYLGSGGESEIYFWVVPAKVAGTWHWQLPFSGKNRRPTK